MWVNVCERVLGERWSYTRKAGVLYILDDMIPGWLASDDVVFGWE